ncbi:MAG: M48 family metallopeptidase [Ignavibacteriae bacterium]|nr:M48 family metallopeptidase [Ignavibacteriota bacterium]
MTSVRHAGGHPTPVLSASESPSPKVNPSSNPQAKEYSKKKIWLGITGTVFFFAFTLAVLAAGFSVSMEEFVRGFSSNDYIILLLFVAVFGLAEAIISFPLKYYSGFYLEHKYNLSNQTFLKWIWEGLKSTLVGSLIGTPVLLAFYYCIKNFQELWWLPVGGVLFFFSVVLARLSPTLIFPLFYKFKPIEDGGLKSKIIALCEKVGMRVEGVFVFNLSKNTKKANAAFAGIGKSKRIILGDTLVANFTDEEIETVFAHELGHYKLKHIRTMMVIGTISTFLGLYLTAALYQTSLAWFGFSSLDQIAALPLLTLWLGVYSLVTSPLSNAMSRKHERQADRYAVELTSNKQAFSNALLKLAKTNLADTSPHPLVEFLFYSHPSIEKRVRFVEGLGS